MAGRTGTLVSAAAAALLAASGQAHAQDDQQYLSAEAVKSFLEQAEQDMTQAVRAGDYARLIAWVKDRVADEAAFFASQELYVDDQRKSFAVASLDKQDMLRLTQIMVEAMSGMRDQALQDYSLDIEVVDVHPIGPNAATAKTRIVESGTFVLAGGSGGQASGTADTSRSSQAGTGTAGAQGTQAEPIEVEATAECSHLIRRGENGGQLLLGMTTCQADIQF